MTVSCNFCQANDAAKLFVRNGYDIVRCIQCGLIYVGNPPNLSELPQYYSENYYTGKYDQVFKDYMGEREMRIRSFHRKLRTIKKYCKGGRLLDIGCAAGFFLEAVKEDYDVQGVEISEYSSRYAREQLGHRVVTGTVFDAQYPDEYFDIVTMWDVLEHVQEPKQTLGEIQRILKPGGLLVISTGDISSINARMHKMQWALLAPPWHLYFFSKKILCQKIVDLGYRVVGFETNGNLFGTKNKLIYNFFTARIIAILKLGDIITVYAQKNTVKNP